MEPLIVTELFLTNAGSIRVQPSLKDDGTMSLWTYGEFQIGSDIITVYSQCLNLEANKPTEIFAMKQPSYYKNRDYAVFALDSAQARAWRDKDRLALEDKILKQYYDLIHSVGTPQDFHALMMNRWVAGVQDEINDKLKWLSEMQTRCLSLTPSDTMEFVKEYYNHEYPEEEEEEE
jgi:hypothetical protein